jgi:hypothetical protein
MHGSDRPVDLVGGVGQAGHLWLGDGDDQGRFRRRLAIGCNARAAFGQPHIGPVYRGWLSGLPVGAFGPRP